MTENATLGSKVNARASVRRRAFEFALLCKVLLILALVASADFLFFDHRVGISVAVFLLLVAIVAHCASGFRGSLRWKPALFLLAALLPLVEEVNVVSIAFATAGIFIFVAISLAPTATELMQGLRDALYLAVASPFRFWLDLLDRRCARWSRLLPSISLSGLGHWVLPLVAALVFVAIFSAANPLIEKALRELDLRSSYARIDTQRMMFWGLVFVLMWPFAFFRQPQRRRAVVRRPASPGAGDRRLFSFDAVLRSLVLLNVVFAWQTISDVAYLWGGAELPAGVTYAQYAQRGAYALISAALLAAGFLLAALRPGVGAESSRLARILIFTWIAQNVLMMVSAAVRLQAYVEAYSLTLLRVAAFVLIALIACGFLLIVLRLLWAKPNGWLIRSNAAVAAMALYLCAFPDFSLIVARYNIAHSRQMTGHGAELDLYYLGTLGPHAMPAAQSFFDGKGATLTYQMNVLAPRERILTYLRERDGWRAWSFRDERLRAYAQARYRDGQ